MRSPEECADAGLTLARELLQANPRVLGSVGQTLTALGKTLEALSSLGFALHEARRRAPADMPPVLTTEAPVSGTIALPPASATPTHADPLTSPETIAAIVRHAVQQAVLGQTLPPVPPAAASTSPPPPPPRPSRPPLAASLTCEEAQQQRRDGTRVATLRVNGMVFLEKVHYYLQLLDDAYANHNPTIATEVLCALECLPGPRPALPAAEIATAKAIWDQGYAILQARKASGEIDADDEVTILGKLGDDPHRPADTLALGQDAGPGDPFAPAPGEPPLSPEDV